jgi:hypothetical protein
MIAWLSNYRPILEEALERRVYCQVIMPKPDLDQGLGEPIEVLSKYPNFFLRLISESPPNIGFSVWDRKEILLSTSSMDSPFPFPTLWSNNKSIVELSQDYFDCIWQKAHETYSTIDNHSFSKEKRNTPNATNNK